MSGLKYWNSRRQVSREDAKINKKPQTCYAKTQSANGKGAVVLVDGTSGKDHLTLRHLDEIVVERCAGSDVRQSLRYRLIHVRSAGAQLVPPDR